MDLNHLDELLERIFGEGHVPERVTDALDLWVEYRDALSNKGKLDLSSVLALLATLNNDGKMRRKRAEETSFQDEALFRGDVSEHELEQMDFGPPGITPLPEKVRRRLGAVYFRPRPVPLVPTKPVHEYLQPRRPGGYTIDWAERPEGTRVEFIFNEIVRPGFHFHEEEPEAKGYLRLE